MLEGAVYLKEEVQQQGHKAFKQREAAQGKEESSWSQTLPFFLQPQQLSTMA